MEDTIVSLRFVVAEIADPEPHALGPLSGDVTRRPASEVYAELRRVDEAENAKLS